MSVIGSTSGLVSQVMAGLEKVSEILGTDVRVTSGKRSGNVDSSPHNSGIGADIAASGFKTVALADALVAAGFSGVGEYYKADGSEDFHAHGDIRGLPGAESSGAYAAGGAKSAKLCWYREGPESTGSYTYGSRKSGNACP